MFIPIMFIHFKVSIRHGHSLENFYPCLVHPDPDFYHGQHLLDVHHIQSNKLRRQCLNELQKEYCVKIKLIALDWQWVTLISWCQMNRDVHSSPAMHKVEGETHFFWEIEDNDLKINLILMFFCEVISDYFCSHLYFSKYKWYYPNTSHMSVFVLILFSLYCWLFDDSAFVLGPASKKDKNNSVQLVSWEVKLFWKIKFLTTFMKFFNIWKIVCIT